MNTQEITTARAQFPKPAREYEIVSFYGPNIVTSEGEEWKKYRKISAPAFSHVRTINVRLLFFNRRFYFFKRNNKLVWDETIKIMNGLFMEVWAGKDVISLDHTLEITLAVYVYSSFDITRLSR